MHLDEDKLEALRRWGNGLRNAAGEEYSAAGRAILLLIEEIDHLQLELANARRQPSSEEAAAAAEEAAAPSLEEPLQEALRRESPSSASPQSWLESLRRQK